MPPLPLGKNRIRTQVTLTDFLTIGFIDLNDGDILSSQSMLLIFRIIPGAPTFRICFWRTSSVLDGRRVEVIRKVPVGNSGPKVDLLRERLVSSTAHRWLINISSK